MVDIYRRSFVKDQSDRHYLNASKLFTILWGVIALIFAATADLFENLIQAVNIIGSLFYGVILGVFMVAFFMKWIGARAVFPAAVLGELFVLALFLLNRLEPEVSLFGYTFVLKIAYLWLNLIGCVLVMLLSWLFQSSQQPAASG